MYHVLIVDDEALSVRTLRKTIHWDELEVDQVFEASNGLQAQRILQEEQIHLVICDIEMPQMDGLQLLEWTRMQQLDVELILLTCHASFDMAQTALRLGSAEYILKPVVPQALQESCRRALARWREKENDRSIRQLWDKGLPLRREQFYTEVIHRSIPPTLRAMENRARAYGVPFDGQERVSMVLVCMQQAEPLSRDAQAARFGLRNVAQELWQEVAMGWECLVQCAQSQFVLLGTQIPEMVDLERDICRRLEGFAQAHLDMTVRADSRRDCPVQDLCRYREVLQSRYERERFVALSPQDSAQQSAQWIWRSAVTRWQGYVKNHTPRLIQEEIVDALKNREGVPEQRSQYLTKLQSQVLLAVRSGLHQQVEDGLGLEVDMPHSRERAAYTDAQFLAWLEWLLQKVEQIQKGEPSDSALVEKIQKYIVLHIHQEITREEIAQAVYLSPDYVARIFKRETGLTLNAYIVEKRIGLAKQLLSSTEIPVGDISSNLGYSSFSHFTKLFKNSEGVTPSEYRKLHRSGG